MVPFLASMSNRFSVRLGMQCVPVRRFKCHRTLTHLNLFGERSHLRHLLCWMLQAASFCFEKMLPRQRLRLGFC